MTKLQDLAERIERLLLRHEELQRANHLLAAQLNTVSSERDSLKSRLGAARSRIAALIDRLPADMPLIDTPVADPSDDRNTAHSPAEPDTP